MSGIEILLLAGAAATAGSQVMQGMAQQAAHNRTAKRLERDAETARLVGAQEAELALEDSRRAQGAAVAEAGGSGFGIDGTVFDGLAAIARAGALDAQTVRYEAMERATGFGIEAQEQRIQGRTSLITGFAQGGASLLSGAGVALSSGGGGARSSGG